MKFNISNFFVYLFSFFLAFGKYDPFKTNGFYFDVIILCMIFCLALFTNVLSKFKIYESQLLILIYIGIIIFVAGVFYGEPIFNFKYFSAILIFWFLSYFFRNNPKTCIYSLLFFATSSSLIALLYTYGYFSDELIIKQGRLIIFEENPNSISSRMAISFIVLMCIIIENPLKFNRIRFIFILALPSLFIFVVDTGSRGSFLGLILGTVLLALLAKIPKSYKFLISFCVFMISISSINFMGGTSLFERFYDSDRLIGVREEIWSNAMQIFYDYPFGVGEIGYVSEMIERYSMEFDTHNLFIYFLVTGGFTSFLLFIYFLKKLFLKSIINFKNGSSLTLIIFAFLIFLISKTGGVLTYLMLWYLFSIINSFEVIENNFNVISRGEKNKEFLNTYYLNSNKIKIKLCL